MFSKLDESNNEKSTNKSHYAFVEFPEFHNTLFNKKILRHTMRGIKSKNHNFGTYKLIKYLYDFLMINNIFSKIELIH